MECNQSHAQKRENYSSQYLYEKRKETSPVNYHRFYLKRLEKEEPTKQNEEA